jgi:hypothetical protein
VYKRQVAPVADPGSGTYASAMSISLSSLGSQGIHYSNNGVPDCSSGNVYTGSFWVSSDQTINAVACYADGFSSTVSSYTYTIDKSSGGNDKHEGVGVVSTYCGNASPVAAPSLFQIDVNNTSAKLFFTPIANVNKYFISFSTKSFAEEFGTEVNLAKEGVQSYTVYHLKPSTTYYFKVRGQNGCMPGTWSNIVKITTRSGNFSKALSFFKGSISKPISNIVQKISKTPKVVQQKEVVKNPVVNVPTEVPVSTQKMAPVEEIVPTSIPKTKSVPVSAPVVTPTPKKICFLWWCF